MSLENYNLENLIRHGSWTKVYRSEDSHNGQGSVIVKILDTERMDLKDRDLFNRERDILQVLDHPQIPKVIESGENHFVMEDVGDKNLYQHIKNKRLDQPFLDLFFGTF